MNRVVLITGASSGIGLATAHRMARGASRLFLAGRSPDRLQRAAAELKATPLQMDLADAAAIEQAVDVIRREAGRLDVLVNCAGQLEVGPADQTGLEAAERLIRVNFLGAVAAIHASLDLLRKGRTPAIVNVSSLAGRISPPYLAAYSASKFALNGYSRALRQELRPEGIHVGLVMPGPVNTPMVQGRLGGVYYPRPPGVPVLTPEQVAQAILVVIERRVPEVVLPRRLSIAARLGAAFPGFVDRFYGGMVAGLYRRKM